MKRTFNMNKTPLCLTLALLLGASTSVFANVSALYFQNNSYKEISVNPGSNDDNPTKCTGGVKIWPKVCTSSIQNDPVCQNYARNDSSKKIETKHMGPKQKDLWPHWQKQQTCPMEFDIYNGPTVAPEHIKFEYNPLTGKIAQGLAYMDEKLKPMGLSISNLKDLVYAYGQTDFTLTNRALPYRSIYYVNNTKNTTFTIAADKDTPCTDRVPNLYWATTTKTPIAKTAPEYSTCKMSVSVSTDGYDKNKESTKSWSFNFNQYMMQYATKSNDTTSQTIRLDGKLYRVNITIHNKQPTISFNDTTAGLIIYHNLAIKNSSLQPASISGLSWGDTSIPNRPSPLNLLDAIMGTPQTITATGSVLTDENNHDCSNHGGCYFLNGTGIYPVNDDGCYRDDWLWVHSWCGPDQDKKTWATRNTPTLSFTLGILEPTTTTTTIDTQTKEPIPFNSFTLSSDVQLSVQTSSEPTWRKMNTILIDQGTTASERNEHNPNNQLCFNKTSINPNIRQCSGSGRQSGNPLLNAVSNDNNFNTINWLN